MKQSKDWGTVIADWRVSGKSRKAFCTDEELSYWTFRDKLKQQTTSRLVRIKTPAVHNTDAFTIDLICHSNLIIRLREGYPRDLLKMVIEDLGMRSC